MHGFTDSEKKTFFVQKFCMKIHKSCKGELLTVNESPMAPITEICHGARW